MSAHQKLSIQHHLASILSLSPTDDEDYISEILDQLLSIESAEDVAEYLGNFVADEAAGDVALFVEELGGFKSGPMAASTQAEGTAKTEEKKQNMQAPSSGNRILDEGAAQREEIRLRELEAREKQRMEQERLRMKKEDEEMRRQREAESKNVIQSVDSKFKWEKNVESSSSAIRNANQTAPKPIDKGKQPTKMNTTQQTTTPTTKKVDTMPSKPLKGTPKSICGCLGNKHAPLTNCLHCGRISCEREGYDYCPFCNHLITQFMPSSNSKHDSALAHKERLLEYDRTSVSRTHVHDDQEDYFVTQSSMWSSAQEQEEASALEEERRKKVHQRGSQKLDINF
jgi:hypothetical protein